MCFLYILKSLHDNGYYVGISHNIARRLKQHNLGRVRSTKSRKPFILIYKEKYPTRLEARSREKYLKSYSGVSEKREITNKFDNIGE